jgi:hypothetical protein
MNIYFKIMHKTVYPSGKPIPENVNIFELDECFPLEHSGLNIVPGFYKNVLISRIFSGKSEFRKFDFLRDNINNIFISAESADMFMDYFCKMQRKYFTLLCFIEKCKYSKAKIQVAEDLYMNPLREGGAGVFALVQCGKKYLFSLANLIHYINVALTHAPNFFTDPLPIKNPYNNVIFNKSTLYKLFFAIKSSTYLMPVVFHYFFMVDFNIEQFQSTYESQLRDIAIENYLKNMETEHMHYGIMRMLKEFARKIRIADEFPKKQLVEIMRPYYRLYCIHSYAMEKYKKIHARDQLRSKLAHLYNYNPGFGRKIYKHERSLFGKKLLVNFNDQHPPFHKRISIENFMKNHGQYICETTYQMHILGDDSDEEQSEISDPIVGAGPFEYESGEEGEIIEDSDDEEEAEIIEDSDDEEEAEIIEDSDDEEEAEEEVIIDSFDEEDE